MIENPKSPPKKRSSGVRTEQNGNPGSDPTFEPNHTYNPVSKGPSGEKRSIPTAQQTDQQEISLEKKLEIIALKALRALKSKSLTYGEVLELFFTEFIPKNNINKKNSDQLIN